MFVLDTCREPSPMLYGSDDIRAEIALLKEGLAATLSRKVALETARELLEPFDDDITRPILSELYEGEQQTQKEEDMYCQEILSLQSALREILWQ